MLVKYPLLAVFILIFALSGFSGLIYESIWSHYLKLFLGHSSYAQVLVLAIFMGGMAIGATLVSQYAKRLHNMILAYGICEGIIGLCALGFHSLYIWVDAQTFGVLFPAMGDAFVVQTLKWLIASLLILPQSILLGATFPLLASGLIRRFPNESGKTLASLYFVNSLGAAIGILCNTFIFIPKVGLPGAIMTAGLINIALAIMVYRLAKSDHYPQTTKLQHSNTPQPALTLLLIAALTGMASFMYEIGWIRMLTMVLGGSTHAFELMLSAFILGLAIGGLMIRGFIERIRQPMLLLAIIQVCMGVLAALTLPLYNQTYEWMGFILDALKTSDSGYQLYSLFSYSLALVVMLPATICAGTTLPLVTHILLKSGQTDAAIGKVYAFNTLGSIIGVILAIQLLMPMLGLKWLILAGAFIDIGLGILLLYLCYRVSQIRQFFYIASALLLGLLVLTPNLNLDISKMASGVFRYGKRDLSNSQVIFHYDGKTSTVAVKQEGQYRSLLNNGKPDAGLKMTLSQYPQQSNNKTFNDESTMVLLGSLPYIYFPQAKHIANIGLGSGLTTHTLLHNQELEQLDSIEIEQGVVDATRYFRPNIDNLFTDDRSQIHIEDAKSYFAIQNKQYDVIVSEPPNPWVSGVAGLFSLEFYQHVQRYLQPDGVFVQWMHLYEISPELVATVYQAISANFKDVHFYYLSSGDIALIASNQKLEANYESVFTSPGLKQELAKIRINTAEDLAFRKLADRHKLDLFFAPLAQNPNSDFFPILDQGAAKSRFLKATATSIYQLHHSRALDKLTQARAITPMGSLTTDMSMSFITHFNQAKDFFEQLESKQQWPIVPENTSNNYAWKVHTLLEQCPQVFTPDKQELASQQLIAISLWLFSYANETKQQQLLDKFLLCEGLFNNTGLHWLKLHQAWFNSNWAKVYAISTEMLEQAKTISTMPAKQVLIFNLTSQIFLGINNNLASYSEKTNGSLLQDMELRALFHLLK